MHDVVQDYYGKVLQKSDDLQTNACCTDNQLSDTLKNILANIHDEVLAKYYGCGLVVPEALKGCQVLDLGSGAGRDCYAIAQMVGEQGFVTGVDMTPEQLDVAERHIDYHREKFDFKRANTAFKFGYIEKLDELDIKENSLDVIVSNCVINLSTDKQAVLGKAFRLLKPGGEIYFADVYADRRIPKALQADPVLYGECLSGALYQQDFIDLAKKVGFKAPYLVNSRAISIDNVKIVERLGDIQFVSTTYRLFKADDLDNHEEDYGQTVLYRGGIENHLTEFHLDAHNRFIKDVPTAVSGNCWRILKASRFAKYFLFNGDFSHHKGTFKAENTLLTSSTVSTKNSCETPPQSSGCC